MKITVAYYTINTEKIGHSGDDTRYEGNIDEITSRILQDKNIIYLNIVPLSHTNKNTRLEVTILTK